VGKINFFLAKLRENAVSPTRLAPAGDDFDEFNRVRVAGFGVERLQPKMKASPKAKHQALQTDEEEESLKVSEKKRTGKSKRNSRKRYF